MKRLDIDSESFGNADVLIESDDGDYVEWKYVQELVDEVARLRKLLWDLSHPPKYIPHESQIKKFREVQTYLDKIKQVNATNSQFFNKA